MNVFLVVVILFVATATAFENDQRKESNAAIHEFKHLVALKAVAEEIRPLDLVRARRGIGVSPECINAGLQIATHCPFDLSDIAKLNTGGETDPRILNNLYDAVCNNDACYNGIAASLTCCGGFQSIFQLFEEATENSCRRSAKGTFCWEASLAIANNNSCLPNITSCATDLVCKEYFRNLTEEYGCCIKDLMDRSPIGDLFESCGLPNPGNCQPSRRSKVTPSVCAPTPASTSRTEGPIPTPPPPTPPTDSPTPSPLPPTPPIPVLPRCNRKAEEFIKMRECSAGIDIRNALIFARPLSYCEYQLFNSRFCQFQKCMDNFVDALQVCFNELGLDEGNSSETLDIVVQLQSKLLCAKDPQRKDFCAVMFPEITSFVYGPIKYNLTCALSGNMCSSECSEEVERAIDHYGCCLSRFLKIRLSVNPSKVYKRCNVTPPKPCRSKLKDPRAK